MPESPFKAQILEGEALFLQGDFGGALAAFEAVLAADPDDVFALNDAGLACAELGHVVEASRHFERALTLAPQHEPAFFNLLDLLAGVGDLDLLLEAYLKYGSAIPDGPEKERYRAALTDANAAVQTVLQPEPAGTGSQIRTEPAPLRTAAEEDPVAVQEGMVSIIIPTRTRAYLEACIASIEAQSGEYPNFEVIIVNDGSVEADFLSFLEETPHRVLHLPENRGFAKACNAGFRAARGEYVMTLNADTVVHPGWLTALVDTLEACPDAGAAGPTILDLGTDTIQAAGSDWEEENYRKFRPRHAGLDRSACPAAEARYRVDGLVGVCMLFRRSALFEVGLFDEHYLNGWEDMDICLALMARGYALYHAPAVIEHKGSFIRDTFDPAFYRDLVQKNRAYFLRKWGDVTVAGHQLVGREERAAPGGEGPAGGDGGDLEAAKRYYEAQLSERSDAVWALNNLGLIALRQEEPARALRYGVEALRANLEGLEVGLSVLSLALCGQNRSEAAEWVDARGREVQQLLQEMLEETKQAGAAPDAAHGRAPGITRGASGPLTQQGVFIGGCHRSGTSFVARSLNLCGVALGRRIGRRGHDNPKGFWEDDFFVELNDRILAANGGSWHSIPARIATELEAAHVAELCRDKEGAVWGLKDPRISITYPAYRRWLPNFALVGCLRHPLSVARSLSERNGFSVDQGLALWYGYNEHLLRWAADYDVPLFWVEYPSGRGLEAVADALELDYDPARIASWFDEALLHHHDEGAAAPSKYQALYDRICSGIAA